MINHKMKQKSAQTGFTLVESIVAMVVMAIAMTVLFSLFFPRIEDSGRPQYIVRASALGQSVMNTILSRGFDEHSDPSGGIYRCGEDDEDGNPNPCTTDIGPDGALDPSTFNDVDDYIGCWYSEGTKSECINNDHSYPLTEIVSDDCNVDGHVKECYPNFKVLVDVENTTPDQMKKITLTISSQRYEQFTLVAYRGNY